MNLKPLHDRVLVERVEQEDRTKGGIIIPDTAQEKPMEGKVISVGNLVEVIKQEDVVWYDRHAGHVIEYDGKFYFVIKASDIVLVD